jgi:hypothetical protein
MLQTAPCSKKTTSKKAAHDRFIYRNRLEAWKPVLRDKVRAKNLL